MSATTDKKEKKPKQIIPRTLLYLRCFTAKEVWTREETNSPWERHSAESDEAVANQVNEFIDEEKVLITQVSAPSLVAFEDAPFRRVYVSAVSVVYTPASEGAVDAH